MSTPKYVARIARLPEVFERLAAHPAGVPLADLAAGLGVPAPELREDLLAYYSADIDSEWLLGLSRPEVVEFLGPDGAEEDPGLAEIVRIRVDDPANLGVEYVDASELALVHAAALALRDLEPDNAELAEAIDVLAETMYGEPATVPDVRSWNRNLQPLQQAQRDGRAVRIVYSRAWEPGVSEREVEPYRLVQTRRGWEIDAGPLKDGRVRTYLLSNIREVEVLDRSFAVPAGVDELVAANRGTTPVRVCLPQAGRWAADFYAEHVSFVEDDEESVVVDVDLLPPLERRVGMLLLAAGPLAFVVAPAELDAAGAVLAEELLIHHSAAPAE